MTTVRGERESASELRSLIALEQEAADLDASRALGVLRRRWPVVVLVPLLFAAFGFGWSARRDKVYESSAYVVVRPTAADAQFAQLDTGDPTRELQTDTQLINGAAFGAMVRAKVGGPADYSAGTVFGTSIISITGKGSSGESAAAVANAAAEIYVSQRREQIVTGLTAAAGVLSTRLGALQGELEQVNGQLGAAVGAALSTLQSRQLSLITQVSALRQRESDIEIAIAVTSGGARISGAALPSDSPVAPRPTRSAVLFGMLGALVGVAAAVALEKVTDVLGRADAFERQLPGVPLLASVPALGSPHTGVLLLAASQSASAEAIRTLRTSMQSLALGRPLRRIQVTSASEDEGGSVVAANLAVAFAGAGLRVVVVDADLRRPSLHTYFGVDGQRGFMTVLVGQDELSETLQPIAMQGWLRVLASGPRPTNPSEILASGHLAQLLTNLEERCDLVIIDSPPVLPYTDAAVIASFVDATVLVAQPGRSKVTPLRRALRTLRVVESNVAGVVLSELDQPVASPTRRREASVSANAPAAVS